MTRWLYRIGRPNRATTLKAHNETSGEKTLRIFDLVLAAMSVSGLPRGRPKTPAFLDFRCRRPSRNHLGDPPRRPNNQRVYRRAFFHRHEAALNLE